MSRNIHFITRIVILAALCVLGRTISAQSTSRGPLLPALESLRKPNKLVVNPDQIRGLNQLVEKDTDSKRNPASNSKYQLIEQKFNQASKPKSLDVFHNEEVLNGSCIQRIEPNQTAIKSIQVFVSSSNKKNKVVRILPRNGESGISIFTPLEERYPDYLPLSGILKFNLTNSLFYSHKEMDSKKGIPPKTHIYRLRQLQRTDRKNIFVIAQLCSNTDGCAYGKNEELDSLSYGEAFEYCIFESK